MRNALLLALALLSGLAPTPVEAAPRRGGRRAAPARPQRSPADDTSPMEAKLARFYFRRASGAYEAGDYHAALADFELARRFMPDAAFDYNIGRCLDRLEAIDDAIVAYGRFLASRPADASEADRVKRRVAVLRSRLARRGVR